jgi:hypothetical protein
MILEQGKEEAFLTISQSQQTTQANKQLSSRQLPNANAS